MQVQFLLSSLLEFADLAPELMAPLIVYLPFSVEMIPLAIWLPKSKSGLLNCPK